MAEIFCALEQKLLFFIILCKLFLNGQAYVRLYWYNRNISEMNKKSNYQHPFPL